MRERKLGARGRSVRRRGGPAVPMVAAALVLALLAAGGYVALRRGGADGERETVPADGSATPGAGRAGEPAEAVGSETLPPPPPLPPPPEGPAIRALGVIGNSGESGASLVRCARYPQNQRSTGAALGDDFTLWVSGGDRVNRLSLSGELLESFELEPAGSLVESRTFAVLDGTLYFFGSVPGRPSKASTLFSLPMRVPAGEKAKAKPLPVQLPKRERDYLDYVMAAQPLSTPAGERLVIVNEPPDNEPPGGDRLDVHYFDPATNALRKAFSLSGESKAGPPYGAAVDPVNGIIYVGAHKIAAVRPDGSPAGGAFPIPCMKTPAIPTQFRGLVSLAGGALWDSAWYGFMSRHSTDGRNAPGRVVEWHNELDYPTQVVEIAAGGGRHDALLVTCATPGAFYFVHWDRPAQKFVPVRRLGAMPDIYSLGLSPEGWVTASTARTQLWWRWEDGHDAPPHKADIHLAVTPPHFAALRSSSLRSTSEGASFVAAAAQYELDPNQKRPLTIAVFASEVTGRNEAHRVVQELPFEKPVGQSARLVAGKQHGVLYFTDATEKSIWAIDFWRPQLRPDASKWREVEIKGVELQAPTDLAALTDGRLLVADGGAAGGRVLLLEPEGDGFRLGWELASWGDGPGERFGSDLRMSASGSWMLVSDTERHRLVWLDWQKREIVALFGETDRPGDDLARVHSPEQVSVQGTRAVVADAGNQRILKLVLRP